MKTTRAVLIVLAWSLAPAFGAYTYDAPHLLNPYSANNWYPNGVNNASTGLYTSADAAGFLIWCCTVPGVSNSYEVRATLALPSASSAGGNYAIYLRTGDAAAWLNNGNASNFYAVQIARSASGDTVTISKNTGANTLTVLATRFGGSTPTVAVLSSSQREKLAVAQRRHDPALGDLHVIFRLRFTPRLVRPRGHDPVRSRPAR
jgi:hypothetical protein